VGLDQLKVNVMASRAETLHVDTLDLYSARHRAAFIKQAADELYVEEPVIKKDLDWVITKLGELRDQQTDAALAPADEKPVLTEPDKQAALALLRDRRLMDRILEDFTEACGVVGERSNKLICYLACVSRKLERPLAVLIQSCSAAGKTSLMDAVLSLVPPEDQVKYSAMTGQSLFYMGQVNLKAPHPGHRRGRGGGASQLRAKTAAERRAAADRQHGQGPEHRAHGNPGVPGRGAVDDLSHDHLGRGGPGAGEPLPGAVGG
jgi:hypothetical protein